MYYVEPGEDRHVHPPNDRYRGFAFGYRRLEKA